MPQIYEISGDKQKLLISTGPSMADWFTAKQLGKHIKKGHYKKAAKKNIHPEYITRAS